METPDQFTIGPIRACKVCEQLVMAGCIPCTQEFLCPGSFPGGTQVSCSYSCTTQLLDYFSRLWVSEAAGGNLGWRIFYNTGVLKIWRDIIFSHQITFVCGSYLRLSCFHPFIPIETPLQYREHLGSLTNTCSANSWSRRMWILQNGKSFRNMPPGSWLPFTA